MPYTYALHMIVHHTSFIRISSSCRFVPLERWAQMTTKVAPTAIPAVVPTLSVVRPWESGKGGSDG